MNNIYVCTCCNGNLFVVIAAGASLVQWNKMNGNVVASAHDSDIRIWDMRVCKPGLDYAIHVYRVLRGILGHLRIRKLLLCIRKQAGSSSSALYYRRLPQDASQYCFHAQALQHSQQ